MSSSCPRLNHRLHLHRSRTHTDTHTQIHVITNELNTSVENMSLSDSNTSRASATQGDIVMATVSTSPSSQSTPDQSTHNQSTPDQCTPDQSTSDQSTSAQTDTVNTPSKISSNTYPIQTKSQTTSTRTTVQSTTSKLTSKLTSKTSSSSETQTSASSTGEGGGRHSSPEEDADTCEWEMLNVEEARFDLAIQRLHDLASLAAALIAFSARGRVGSAPGGGVEREEHDEEPVNLSVAKILEGGKGQLTAISFIKLWHYFYSNVHYIKTRPHKLLPISISTSSTHSSIYILDLFNIFLLPMILIH